MHAAMKPLMKKMRYPSRDVDRCYDLVDKTIKAAISNFQADHQAKQSNCFPSLKQAEKNRKYLQNGFKPSDPAHCKCISCGRSYIDEPNTKLGLQSQYEKTLCEYEERRRPQRKKRTRTKPQPNTFQFQKWSSRTGCVTGFFCLSVGSSAIGSSCPIKCKDPEPGLSYGTTMDGTCACPICKCPCSVAYTNGAAQII